MIRRWLWSFATCRTKMCSRNTTKSTWPVVCCSASACRTISSDWSSLNSECGEFVFGNLIIFVSLDLDFVFGSFDWIWCVSISIENRFHDLWSELAHDWRLSSFKFVSCCVCIFYSVLVADGVWSPVHGEAGEHVQGRDAERADAARVPILTSQLGTNRITLFILYFNLLSDLPLACASCCSIIIMIVFHHRYVISECFSTGRHRAVRQRSDLGQLAAAGVGTVSAARCAAAGVRTLQAVLCASTLGPPPAVAHVACTQHLAWFAWPGYSISCLAHSVWCGSLVGTHVWLIFKSGFGRAQVFVRKRQARASSSHLSGLNSQSNPHLYF